MSTRTFALLLAIVFLLIGIAGFVPSLMQPMHPEHPPLALSANAGQLFGLFPVNVLHSGLHILFGLWGLVASRSMTGAKLYARGVGRVPRQAIVTADVAQGQVGGNAQESVGGHGRQQGIIGAGECRGQPVGSIILGIKPFDAHALDIGQQVLRRRSRPVKRSHLRLELARGLFSLGLRRSWGFSGLDLLGGRCLATLQLRERRLSRGEQSKGKK